MYHSLPSWIPILSTSLTCLLYLILIDTLGWIYGFLTWLLLTLLVFDKLSQGLIERGMCRIHQGLVWGYYLSILWINLRYFGGLDTGLLPKSFFSIGRSTPSNSTLNMTSPDLPSIICILSLFSLFLAVILSIKKPHPYNSMEDRYVTHTTSTMVMHPQVSSPFKDDQYFYIRNEYRCSWFW